MGKVEKIKRAVFIVGIFGLLLQALYIIASLGSNWYMGTLDKIELMIQPVRILLVIYILYKMIRFNVKSFDFYIYGVGQMFFTIVLIVIMVFDSFGVGYTNFIISLFGQFMFVVMGYLISKEYTKKAFYLSIALVVMQLYGLLSFVFLGFRIMNSFSIVSMLASISFYIVLLLSVYLISIEEYVAPKELY